MHWRNRRRVRRRTSGRSFVYNLRFPGQYYDVETGLNYNYFRDYDPAVGRYVESDPIGLRGGSYSTYAYTNGNPINAIDPLGLAPPARTAPSPGIPAIPTWPSNTQWSHDAALGFEDWLNRVGNAIGRMCKEATNECFNRYGQETERCEIWRGRGPVGDRDRWYRACKARAADRYRLCLGNNGQPNPEEPDEWSKKDVP
jgi:RHS repeat-associated protein